MKKESTSREALLEAALGLARREGLSAVSMRRVSAAVGVAPGTVYHYYPSKEALLVSVLERFWRDALHGGPPGAETADFTAAFADFWDRSAAALQQFETSFLQQMYALDQQTRRQGKQRERQYLAHIEAGLTRLLLADPHVRPGTWTLGFPQSDSCPCCFPPCWTSSAGAISSPNFYWPSFEKSLIKKEYFYAGNF